MNNPWFYTLCLGMLVASACGASWEAFGAGICVVLALGDNHAA